MAKRYQEVKTHKRYVDPDKKKRDKVIKEKCSQCQYRGEATSGFTYCAYSLITDKLRGCDWRRCTKFVKGKKLQQTGEFII